MKIAIAQMNSTPGALDATVSAMAAYGRRAEELGADLLVFGAPVLMGPDPMGLAANEAYLLDASRSLAALAEKLRVPALVPYTSNITGAPVYDVAYLRDGAAVPISLTSMLDAIGPGDVETVARGIRERLDADAGAEGQGQQAARLIDPAVIELGGVDVGIALSLGDLDAFATGELEADVVCLMPVDGYDTDDEMTCLAPSVSDGCFTREAANADAWLAVAGASGAYDDMTYCGGSFVMAPWGELAAAASSFGEELLFCDIDVLSEGPLPEAVEPPAYDRATTLWRCVATSVRDQVNKRGLSGVALVADGSLASAAVAAVAVDAVGPLRVHALVHAGGDALADARELVRNLRIRDVDEVSARDLEAAAEALGGDGEEGLVASLLEARLGALASAGELLALSCADKTMLAVGEGADVPAGAVRSCAFAPFGDVYRTDVAAVARMRNTVSPVIPTGCLARLRVPSGLGLEQVAQSDELRLSELDALLLLRIERGAGVGELAGSKLGEKGVSLVLGRLRALEAWRRQGPSYPVVSARSLGEAQRPVMDAWEDHVPDEAAAARLVSSVADVIAHPRQRPSRPAAPSPSSPSGPQAPMGGTPLAFTMPPEMAKQLGPRASELMGYLKELSDGRRLRGESGRMWPGGPGGMFSDN